MKGRAIPYSAAELAYIKAMSELPRRELHQLFCQAFDRHDVSEGALKQLCLRNGWKTGRNGCFPKGHEPFNKGKPHRIPGSEKGWFKKGDRPANHTPLWSERPGKGGYIEMKVPEVNPYTGHSTRYVQKHVWLWERKNGPVPDGHCLKSLDGDPHNTDPSNWEAIPRALLPRLSGGRWYQPYQDYEPELRPAVLRIAKLDHANRTAKQAEVKT